MSEWLEDIETPYSKIVDIIDHEDGTISYTEIYNLKHPLCPARSVLINRYEFELFYGSLK